MANNIEMRSATKTFDENNPWLISRLYSLYQTMWDANSLDESLAETTSSFA